MTDVHLVADIQTGWHCLHLLITQLETRRSKLHTLLHALDAYERLYSVIRQQSALNALTSGCAGSHYQCMRME